MVNNHGDRKSSKDRVVGPLPNGLFMAYKWGFVTTYYLIYWDDPPRTPSKTNIAPENQLVGTCVFRFFPILKREHGGVDVATKQVGRR